MRGRAHIRQAQRAGEALVLLGVVVLEVDLQVDGLLELARLAVLDDRLDRLQQLLRRDLRHRVVLFLSLSSCGWG